MTRALLSAVVLAALLDRGRGGGGDARAIGLRTQAARYADNKGDPGGQVGRGGAGRGGGRGVKGELI